ncbi:hypothetical protein MMC17_003862 [Xylographa soralifera]|nr:hypothetical protein [Xylographa soralifera]
MSAQPSQDGDISRLLANITSEGTLFMNNGSHARSRLLEAARALVSELETPRETVIRMCWGETNLFTSAMIARDLKLFAHLDEDGGSDKTVSQLAKMTDADPALLSMFVTIFQ